MTKKAMNLRVGLYQPDDKADILALNLLEHGPTDMMVNPEDFRWRYAENPAGKAQISVVRDEHAHRVAGFAWIIPLQMRLFGKNYLAVMTANQLVHPDYRDSLAYAKLIRHRQRLLRQSDIAFRYTFPIDEIFDRFISIEKMSAFPIPLLVRPLNTAKLARNFFTRRWMQLLGGWGGRIATLLLFYNRDRRSPRHSLKVEWLDQFDERFDDFWERVREKYNIMLVRDRAFLTWRFAPVSERRYRILSALAGDELLGYIVLRCTDEIRDIPIGLIMDMLLEPGSRGEMAGMALLEEAWRYFQTQEVWLAGGFAFPHTAECHVMRRAGYRPSPQRLLPRLFRVTFNCFNDALPDTENVKAGDWFLTIADFEKH